MRQALQFPIEYPDWGNGQLEVTFEPLAIPPRHDLVSSVFGWVFQGNEMLLIQHRQRGWDLPGGHRKSGETFRRTLAREVWEEGGVLLDTARFIGAVRITNHGAPDPRSPYAYPVSYMACFIAEVRELCPFTAEFEAEDRMLIEPELVPRTVKHWSPLMDQMLAFARAVRAPSRVEVPA